MKTWLKGGLIGIGVLILLIILILLSIPSPCLQLINPSEVSECAVEYKDVNVPCKEIKDINERMKCNSEYIKTETINILQRNNIDECKNLKGKAYSMPGLGHITGEEYCYYFFAVERNNISLCETLETVKDKCYRDFATKNKDFSVCEKITGGAWGNEDFCKISLGLQIGRETKDITECNKIETERYKQACIFGVAETLKDPNICEMIIVNERIEAFNFNKEECLERIKQPTVIKK